MTDNFRPLCAELADSVELLLEMRAVDAKPMVITEDRLARARALLAEVQPENMNTWSHLAAQGGPIEVCVDDINTLTKQLEQIEVNEPISLEPLIDKMKRLEQRLEKIQRQFDPPWSHPEPEPLLRQLTFDIADFAHTSNRWLGLDCSPVASKFLGKVADWLDVRGKHGSASVLRKEVRR